MNYYEILGVNKTASEKEIKRAYALLVRKYPPEKNPDEFNQIREAYDNLIDADLRSNYDEMNGFDPSVQVILDKAMEQYNNEEYDDAIKSFKKFLMYEKSNHAKNYLSICYFCKEDYETAYKFVKEILDTNEQLREVYFANLFESGKEIGKNNEVIKYLQKGIIMFDSLRLRILLCRIYSFKDSRNDEKAINLMINEINPAIKANRSEYSWEVYKQLTVPAVVFKRDDLLRTYIDEMYFMCNDSQMEDLKYYFINEAFILMGAWYITAAKVYLTKLLQQVPNGSEEAKLIQNINFRLNDVSKICDSDDFVYETKEIIVKHYQLALGKMYFDDNSEEEAELQNYRHKLKEYSHDYPTELNEEFDDIKSKYPKVHSDIYYLIGEFINIINKTKNQQYSNANTNTNTNNTTTNYNTSNNSTSSNNTSYSSGTSRKSSSSSNGGCGTVILFMIIGSFFGGPIGVAIGAVIALSIID